MRAPLRLLLALCGVALLAAGPARAGQAQCWFENGAVVVAASFGDIAGDFIVDSTAPRSLLHDDVANSHGVDASTASGDLIIAGERLNGLEMQVVSLNEQEVGFPTTINGVIGADVLARYVVRIDFAPCRIAFLARPPRRARRSVRLRVRGVGGVPAIAATASDGTRRRRGLYAVDTASLGVRLAPADTSFSRPLAEGVDPTLRFRPPARLKALTFGGRIVSDLPAGTLEYPLPGLKGAIGVAVWSRYSLTMDTREGWLDLAPATDTPSPLSSRKGAQRLIRDRRKR